jgi:hypothetical protein
MKLLEFRMRLPIQIIVLAVLLVIVLSLGVSIFIPTFAQNPLNDNNQDNFNNTLAKNLQKLNINAKGPIASMVKDNNGTWIIWGDWDLLNNASDVDKISSTPFSFNATITKVKPDNTESNKYKISNFKLDSSFIRTVGSSSILLFNGTGTISTKGEESSQVPMNIRIFDSAPVTASIDMQSGAVEPSWSPKGGTISILIDDKAFGNSPVYGIVKKTKFS